MNVLIISGNLTREPELTKVGDSQVCNFGIANNIHYTSKQGEKKQITTFVDCECWGRTAGVAQEYCAKGRKVLLEGRLKFDEWTAKDGSRRTKISMDVQQLEFMGRRHEDGKEDEEEEDLI